MGDIFLQILNMSITAGYCIAAVLLLRLLFRKAPRKYLYALWLVAAFRLICPVSVSTEFSLFNLERFQESMPSDGTGTMEYIPVQQSGAESPEIHTGIERADLLVNQQIPHAVQTWFRLPVKKLVYLAGPCVWLTGMGVLLLYFIGSLRKLKRSVCRAVRAEKPDPVRGTEHWGAAEVFECDHLSSPFVMGIFHPRIYLPCHLDGRQREMVLLHERYHIRRKDYLVKPLSFFLLTVYWFHPLVWAAWFCMCRDMEMSCDEKVLELLGEGHGKEYSMTLLALASEEHTFSRMPLAFGENDVKSRIRHALSFRRPACWAGILAAVALAAVLIVFGTNGVKREAEEASPEISGTWSEAAQILYDARNPYVGDVPADGEVIRAIREAMPDWEFAEITAYKTELQTSTGPYGYTFILEEAGEGPELTDEQENSIDSTMAPAAALMMALIGNLGEVRWQYVTEDRNGDQAVTGYTCGEGSLYEWYGIENIKEYGISPEKVQELLDILEGTLEMDEQTGEEK